MTNDSIRLIFVALLAGGISLLGYKYFFENNANYSFAEVKEAENNVFPVSYREGALYEAPSLTDAAETTVNAVVHVMNTSLVEAQPRNLLEFFYGGGQPRAQIGTGSGVIISPDGYIITNSHVIENASKLKITLNNKDVFDTKLIGTDPTTDIALLKIEREEPFPYIVFGDSDNIRLGEWVLAVGNPFNLNSTVTAGIISAKARNLNSFDKSPSSFIQTDAAVNRGNSGGALVNANGELIGINTAITSETGSYVGYAFAVPSNIARKVVEDLLLYGNVQRVFLGIQGSELNASLAKELKVSTNKGIYIGEIEHESSAALAGLEKGDVIYRIDQIEIKEFSDLADYISTKRPDDKVTLQIYRGNKDMQIPVTLLRIEKLAIPELGIEIKEPSKTLLEEHGLTSGLLITNVLVPEMQAYGIEGAMITKINDIEVSTIDQVKKILQNRKPRESLAIQFKPKGGERQTFIFR